MSCVIPRGLEELRALCQAICQAMSDFYMGEHMVLVICMNLRSLFHDALVSSGFYDVCVWRRFIGLIVDLSLSKSSCCRTKFTLTIRTHDENGSDSGSACKHHGVKHLHMLVSPTSRHFGNQGGHSMSSRLASSLVKEAALTFLKFYHWPLWQVGRSWNM